MPPLIQKKAFYTMLSRGLFNDSVKSESWQLLNYREIPSKVLFEKLATFGLQLNEKSFVATSEPYDTPEEMVSDLLKENDEAYLVIFELWRRLNPEKESLSIFCDELDELILKDDDKIQNRLYELEKLFEELVDKNIAAEDAYIWIQSHLVADLEAFLYDTILTEIERGNARLAGELVEAFIPFLPSQMWFKYLHARSALELDPVVGFSALESLLEEKPSSELLFEILFFVAQTENHDLFLEIAKHIFPLLKDEEEFCELGEITIIHFEYLNLESAAFPIRELLGKRKKRPKASPLSKYDPDLPALQLLVNQKIIESKVE